MCCIILKGCYFHLQLFLSELAVSVIGSSATGWNSNDADANFNICLRELTVADCETFKAMSDKDGFDYCRIKTAMGLKYNEFTG